MYSIFENEYGWFVEDSDYANGASREIASGFATRQAALDWANAHLG